MGSLKVLNPKKVTRTSMDTIQVTPALLSEWKDPPFQRPLSKNSKVCKLAEIIKDTEVIPGVITLGVLGKVIFRLDGQHRTYAFSLSGLEVAYADVCTHYFDTMAEMGEEFVNINSSLVRMRPDDVLRGIEGTLAPLAHVRAKCPFVGYGNIRRGDYAPVLSMSTMLRCWSGSEAEVPVSGGDAALQLALALTQESADQCAGFLVLAEKAWGRDPEYSRLWSSLNLTMTMWLYRRLVIAEYSKKSGRLTRDEFSQCLMALSASGSYTDWLVGRKMAERDRSPAYNRIKGLFAQRLMESRGTKVCLPQPSWVSSVRAAK